MNMTKSHHFVTDQSALKEATTDRMNISTSFCIILAHFQFRITISSISGKHGYRSDILNSGKSKNCNDVAVVLSLNRSICGKVSVYAFLVRRPVVRKTAVKCRW